MARTQFTFYESFFKAIRRIKKKQDRADAYDMICAYALYQEEPDLDSAPDAVAIAFDLLRPILDKAKEKSENGRRGGKQMESKLEANEKQTESKEEASAEQTASKKENKKEKEGEREIEIEKEKEKEREFPDGKRPDAPQKRTIFVPPSVEQVRAYCQEASLAMEPEAFVDFYASKGWKVGTQTMKDWKAACRNWARRDLDYARRGNAVQAKPSGQRELDEAEREAIRRLMEENA